MPLTSQGPTQQLVPNVYVNILPPLQALNPYINTSLNGFVGVANWGLVDTPVFCDDGASIIYNFGNDTVGATTSGLNASLVEEMITALNEDGNSVGVRVTDGTDTPAVINMPDTASGTLIIFTARMTGSLPMGNPATNTVAAGVRIDAIGPPSQFLYRVTIFFPGQAPIIYNNIRGSIGFGGQGSYSAVTLKNNIVAAVNGTAPNTQANPYFQAAAGSSTAQPLLATVTNPTNGSGTDGTLGVTTSILIGADSETGARTGLYALRGTGAFHACICGCTDLSQAQTLSTFCSSEGIALGFLTVPKGTSDQGAVSLRATNAAGQSNLCLVKDFIYTYDSVLQTYRFVSPIGKAMGIIGLLPPSESPINQPYNTTALGAAGVLSTEQTQNGPRSTDELGYLLSNGFICITNQIPLNNDTYGIGWDVTASGDPATSNGAGVYIPVQRMNVFLAQAIQDIGAPFIGQPQSLSANDPTRANISAAFNNFFTGLKPVGGKAMIDSYKVTCDLTNNNAANIAAGICNVMILVRYLGIVRVLYIQLQAGTNVVITNTPPAAA